jgi:hypothetical protein
MKLNLGDTFWTIQVRKYETILQKPLVRRHVMTGGGDVFAIYQTIEVNGLSDEKTIRQANNFSPGLRMNRLQLEEHAHPTREAALAAGLIELHELRRLASQRMTASANGISEIEQALTQSPSDPKPADPWPAGSSGPMASVGQPSEAVKFEVDKFLSADEVAG